MANVAVAERATAVSAVLPSELSAVQEARAFVHTALSHWDIGAIADDVALVASELVSNALVHGLRLTGDSACGRATSGRAAATQVPSPAPSPAGRVEIKLVSTGSHLICTVRDPSPAAPVRQPADEASLGGRGLQLIESLSLSWGWTASNGAKSVWAIFPLAGARAAALALRAS